MRLGSIFLLTASLAFAAAADPCVPYDRSLYKHWNDADGDGIDCRHEVLIGESEGRLVLEDKRVTKGKWICPYTGVVIRDPSHRSPKKSADVDHLVPLSAMHQRGGCTWDEHRRELYANFEGFADHLVVTQSSANRKKGADGPADYLPEVEENRCWYVHAWWTILQHWGVCEDDENRAAVRYVMQDNCGESTEEIDELLATVPRCEDVHPCPCLEFEGDEK